MPPVSLVAVQVTIVVPTGNTSGASLVISAASSFEVASPKTTSSGQTSAMSDGQAMDRASATISSASVSAALRARAADSVSDTPGTRQQYAPWTAM